MNRLPLTAFVLVAVLTGCSHNPAGTPDTESLNAQFRSAVRAFVEDDDVSAISRATVLGTQLSHPPDNAPLGTFLLEYHRSYPTDHAMVFSTAQPEFARLMRASNYTGFVWYRRDTHSATEDDRPVLLSAWGNEAFILHVRQVVSTAIAKLDDPDASDPRTSTPGRSGIPASVPTGSTVSSPRGGFGS